MAQGETIVVSGALRGPACVIRWLVWTAGKLGCHWEARPVILTPLGTDALRALLNEQPVARPLGGPDSPLQTPSGDEQRAEHLSESPFPQVAWPATGTGAE